MMLVLAPESMIVFSLQPSTVTSIFSSFLPPTVNAYTGSSSSSWQPTIFAAPLLGFLWPLVCFCLLYLSALSCTALENVLPAHIDDRNDLLLDSWNLDRNIGNKFSHGRFWYLVTDFSCHGLSLFPLTGLH